MSRNFQSIAIVFLIIPLMASILSIPRLQAQCVFDDLALEQTLTVSKSPAFMRFSQGAGRWMAIGVRADGGGNWDIGVFGRTAPSPDCVQSPPLEFSDNTKGIDFVVGDFTYNRAGTYYAAAVQPLGIADGLVRWSSKSQLLEENTVPILVNQSPDQFIDCYTVRLVQNTEYTITFNSNGKTGARAFLFYNNESDSYWSNRNGAVAGDTTTFSYYTPVTAWYSIVVTNELAGTGSYTLGVGSCAGYTNLESGNPLWVYEYENRYVIPQPMAPWAAVGFRRPGMATQLDMFGFPFGLPYPVCMTDWYATSVGATWETAIVAAPFGIGGMGPTSYFPRVPQHEPGDLGRVEWHSATEQIETNSTLIHRQTDAMDVLEVWGISLQAGVDYTFNLNPVGETDLNLLLFRNDGDPTWYERADAVLITSEPVQYTPPDAGWYGVVTVNDNAMSGAYSLDVNTCDPPPRLEAGNALNTSPGLPTEYFYLVQQPPVWAVVGVTSADDWDLQIYEHGSGGTPPLACRSGLLATSDETGSQVDFIVGDFNRNPKGDYYPDASLKTGSAQASLLWKYSENLLIPNDPDQEVIVTGTDFIHVFDLFLIAGNEYEIDFYKTTGSADARFLLFEASGDTYWAPRADRILEGSAATLFTPGTTGTYGLVVVNDNGEAGTYYLGVTSPTVSAPTAAAPRQAGIQALVPNPTRGSLTIQFALPEAGKAVFEIVDVAGRVIASIPGQSWKQGRSATEWDGFTSKGNRAAPGVYFVRMKQAGETLGVKRVIMLD